MMTKSDWDRAGEDFMAAERERLGGPPTPEEVVAFLAGELPEREAERVRALLVYYPELTSILTAERPARTPAKVVRAFPMRRVFPLAASLAAMLFAGLFARTQWLLRQPSMISERHVLEPLRHRGGPLDSHAYRLPASEGEHLLVLPLEEHPPYPRYRLDIIDAGRTSPKEVWSEIVTPTDFDGTLTVAIPNEFLDRSTYRIDVYGIAGSKAQRLDSYAIQARPSATDPTK